MAKSVSYLFHGHVLRWVLGHREKYELPFGPDSHLLPIRIGANGEHLQDMMGSKGERPTEVVEREDGRIYLGSMELSYVGITRSS
jgi:hypothetical protein